MSRVSSKVKQSIISEFMKVLKDRDYPYREDAVTKIVETFLKSKKSLINLLSKHPNWNPDKLMIQFDEDYSREFNRIALNEFANWLEKSLRISGRWYTDTDRRVISFFRYDICDQFFSRDMAGVIDRVNAYNENFKLRTNMKASKAILKLCKEMKYDELPPTGELYNSTKERPRYDDFNYEYAKLCDNINPIKVRRHTCISLNPIDFLLMSHGTSWESCHYIDYFNEDPGCYSSGTISYMLDECSFLFYTVDASYTGTDIELEPKVQRQVFGYKDEVFIQSRLYPQSMDCGAEAVYTDIRNVVQKVIADCLELPNLWTKSTNDISDVVEHGEYATCYPDWRSANSGDLCSISRIQGTTKFPKIILGAQPICITCGREHRIEDNISCCESGHYTCCHCGDVIYDEDNVRWVDDEPYCCDCAAYCEDCGDYTLGDTTEVHYTSSWGGYRYTREVCDDCLTNYYHECHECGEYWHNSDMTETEEGHWYCPDCSDSYSTCEYCDEYHDRDELIYDDIDDSYYCSKCYEEIISDREMEEEVV